MVRLSKLVIDPSHLEAYRSALRQEVTASVQLEPGVLTLYAVAEKDRPTHSPFSRSMQTGPPMRSISRVLISLSTRPELSIWSDRSN